jgi:hypothetical protein
MADAERVLADRVNFGEVDCDRDPELAKSIPILQPSGCRDTPPFQNRGNRPLARSGTVVRHLSRKSYGGGIAPSSLGTIAAPNRPF